MTPLYSTVSCPPFQSFSWRLNVVMVFVKFSTQKKEKKRSFFFVDFLLLLRDHIVGTFHPSWSKVLTKERGSPSSSKLQNGGSEANSSPGVGGSSN